MDSKIKMKKLLKIALIAGLTLPTLALAKTPVSTPQGKVVDTQTIVVSPRTGIQYSVNNPNQRPVIIQVEALAPATSTTVDRIVASNPALSVQSQENAKKALLAVQ